MAASEIRRAIIGNIPDCLRNCVNKEYFMRSSSGAGGFSEGLHSLFIQNSLKSKCFLLGLNNGGAGFYSAGLHTQQAHSTTPNTLSHGKLINFFLLN